MQPYIILMINVLLECRGVLQAEFPNNGFLIIRLVFARYHPDACDAHDVSEPR